jgi:RloB-like protein
MARGGSRREDGRNLRRRAPTRDPLPLILVVCEGRVTEPGYVESFRIAHGANTVRVRVESPGGDPRALVECAAELRSKAESEARRARDQNLRYDEVWCVFDVDQHQRLDEARQEAARSQIQLAVSNPSFELWLLLHFHEQTAPLSVKQARDRLRKHLPGYDKHVRFADVSEGYHEAVRRAEALNLRHVEARVPGENPSTGVYQLTERIRAFGRKRLL